jgi:hypothetical protein
MNVDIGIALLFGFIAFVVASIFVITVGQAQNTLEDRLIGDNQSSQLSQQGQDIVEDQSSSFPSVFDIALVLVFVSVIGGYVFMSYAVGQPGLSLVIGVAVLVVASFVGVTLSDVAVGFMESTDGFASQFQYTKHLLENFMYVITGSVTGSVIASALGRRRT